MKLAFCELGVGTVGSAPKLALWDLGVAVAGSAAEGGGSGSRIVDRDTTLPAGNWGIEDLIGDELLPASLSCTCALARDAFEVLQASSPLSDTSSRVEVPSGRASADVVPTVHFLSVDEGSVAFSSTSDCK
mmetsp:Transcript_79013/g.149044  ORF Transcript_79013/g.149044 Transcript_79013/m.149044 type:complete len:131 (+) Transcript_79013:534-926(+)